MLSSTQQEPGAWLPVAGRRGVLSIAIKAAETCRSTLKAAAARLPPTRCGRRVQPLRPALSWAVALSSQSESGARADPYRASRRARARRAPKCSGAGIWRTHLARTAAPRAKSFCARQRRSGVFWPRTRSRTSGLSLGFPRVPCLRQRRSLAVLWSSPVIVRSTRRPPTECRDSPTICRTAPAYACCRARLGAGRAGLRRFFVAAAEPGRMAACRVPQGAAGRSFMGGAQRPMRHAPGSQRRWLARSDPRTRFRWVSRRGSTWRRTVGVVCTTKAPGPTTESNKALFGAWRMDKLDRCTSHRCSRRSSTPTAALAGRSQARWSAGRRRRLVLLLALGVRRSPADWQATAGVLPTNNVS